MAFTNNYSQQISKLRDAINGSDAILLGAGAGLSTAAGLVYDGKHFSDNFADMIAKYHFTDMYTAGFYNFPVPEAKWAYWSRFVYINRYEPPALDLYLNLFKLIRDKNYFVLTTNVDHQFQKSGFSKERLFYTQGDYGLFQCSKPCHQKTYDNETIIKRMVDEQKDCMIPKELLPVCPICGEPISMNLRADDTFVQDDGWYKAANRYEKFVNSLNDKKVLLFELGVGYNTPAIIKYNFWKQTNNNKNMIYACINLDEIEIPAQIQDRSICIKAGIDNVINELL
jgi:NAD-dependent SIR2 family protein deacetylase